MADVHYSTDQPARRITTFLIGNIELVEDRTETRLVAPSRRTMMKAAAAVFTSSLLGASVPETIRIGAQTNAWAIDPNKIDTFYVVLGRIRELGFTGFETGFRNFQSVTDNLAPVRERIASTGLTFFGIHIFLLSYDTTTHIAPAELYEKVVATGAALGAKHLILSGSPCLSSMELANKTAGLNEAGRVAAQQGLRVAYHNHAPEFANKEHEIRFLIANTDPKLVSFVVDAGHAFRAGADVPSFLAEQSNRIVGVHFRDSSDGREVPLGQGQFPLIAAADALHRVRWHGWALLEEERVDGSKPGDAAIVPAVAALRRAFPS